MALETATYIDGLVATNPAASDAINTADDHLRLIKSTIKATFPNITGAVTKTQAEINSAAPLDSPALTGTPTAPTATTGTNTTQIATTAFVKSAVDTASAALGTMSTQNANSVAITGGTITGLSSALPVASGGTGQTTQTAAFDALAPSTTKGDLIVYNGSDNIRLPVGTNSYILTADSTQASGVKWAAAPSSPFSSVFTSSELTVTTGGSQTVAHGLGTRPTCLQYFVVCKSAEGGYSVGDWVDLSVTLSTWTSGTAYAVGFTIVPDSSNIFIRFGSTQAFGLLRKDTGANFFPSSYSNWRLVVRAWA